MTHCPVALTIAGSDSGGGAGIQADLKTFAAFGVHGASAITCLTAQNPRRVLAVESTTAKMLRQQIEAVFQELHPAAVKTGLLLSAENVRVVADLFEKRKRLPLVVDPVIMATSGAPLLKPKALKFLMEKLLPLATLVTPNLHETEILTRRKLTSVEDLRAAAHQIHACLGCAALVKGGHLRGTREAVDVFYDGRTELLLTAPFIKDVRTHGTGCTCSAAITAALALGHDLPRAVGLAKNYITQAIANSYRVGKHFALNPLFH
ncbi:MAG: bifunctional hydroxymethylpyrimidine kinase/phosphomethylpyrimidine kinase [Limisphaerales bacterium]